MPYKLYDYLSTNGKNEFKAWTENLQTPQRAKLNEKLDKLMQYGDELYPQLLTDTPIPGIKKLRIMGNVQLRPMLCSGPVNPPIEYTLLQGATEVGEKFSPRNAPALAQSNKEAVLADPQHRRKDHERVV